MKHIALAALFAASLAAQNEVVPTKPDVFEAGRRAELELASVIAVEEQEKDLVKAQELYREAMVDQERSLVARAYARQRLAALLSRLGKGDEAMAVLKAGGKGMVLSLDDVTNGKVNGQDPEREKQLRMQARELLKLTGRRRRSEFGPELTDKLNWIGEPAVTEVVLHLQDRLKKHQAGSYADELCGFLWRQGGAKAADMLVQLAKQTVLTTTAANAARVLKVVDIQAPEVRAFLDSPEWRYSKSFLAAVGHHLSAEDLLTLAERGGVDMKVYALRNLPRRTLSAKQRDRAHAMCRAAIGGTSPEYAKGAELFLTSSESQQSLAGLEMLFGMMPSLHARNVPVSTFHLPSSKGMTVRKFSKGEVAALIPMVRAVVDKIGPVTGSSPAVNWLSSIIHALASLGAEPHQQLALGMWDMGYEVPYVFHGTSSPKIAKQALQRWERVSSNARRNFLGGFHDVDLPGDALPVLRKILKSVGGSHASRDRSTYEQVVKLIGQTGDDDAADVLIAEWRDGVGSSRRNSQWTPLVWAMLELGKKNQSQRVRSAMGNMVRGFGGPKLSLEDRSRLLVALLSMGDERALDYVAHGTSVRSVHHPYGSEDATMQVSPLNYLMFKNPDPAHPYSRKQVLDTVTRYAQRVSGNGGLDPSRIRVSAIPDDVLAVFAKEEESGYPLNWAQLLVLRLNSRITRGEDFAVLEKCYLSALGDPGRSRRWVTADTNAVIARYRKQLTALVDGPDGDWALQAIKMLRSQEGAVDVATALRSKHYQVRKWATEQVVERHVKVPPKLFVPLLRDVNAAVRMNSAKHLGATVHKQAVPGLIALLRDSDAGVRKVAAEALTRIRFYHEQQAHWDRVLEGLDASQGSATEKLLVQAKPDAKKAQRLLAIKSLGVLGAPEALPFLIDWSQEADTEIAEAAKAAITAIHLSPRK